MKDIKPIVEPSVGVPSSVLTDIGLVPSELFVMKEFNNEMTRLHIVRKPYCDHSSIRVIKERN